MDETSLKDVINRASLVCLRSPCENWWRVMAGSVCSQALSWLSRLSSAHRACCIITSEYGLHFTHITASPMLHMKVGLPVIRSAAQPAVGCLLWLWSLSSLIKWSQLQQNILVTNWEHRVTKLLAFSWQWIEAIDGKSLGNVGPSVFEAWPTPSIKKGLCCFGFTTLSCGPPNRARENVNQCAISVVALWLMCMGRLPLIADTPGTFTWALIFHLQSEQ